MKTAIFEMKRAIFEMLLHESRDGKLPQGAILKVAKSLSVSRRSVSRICSETGVSAAGNSSILAFPSRLVNRVGRKRVQISLEQIKDIPFRRRTNIRSLAKALGVPKTTLQRRIKEENIRPHSNAMKPSLTDENKRTRLQFCLSMIKEGTFNSRFSFVNMYDQIHIDEKWFYMSKTSQKFYIHSEEEGPLRTCKSKRYITKLMFLAAVARPRFDAAKNEMFDEKIGIWPFVSMEAAKRSSKNRVAGTIVTKPILSITKDVIRTCLIEKLLPAIKDKWPSSSGRTIFIQQDNARPHLSITDPGFVAAVNGCDLDIRLSCQPPNSPDMNVLDLGFFRAIDSLQHQAAPSTIDEFIAVVKKAFTSFPIEEANNVYLTLQTCMVEVLKKFGCNNYKIPHMDKQKLIRRNQLPECIVRDAEVVNAAKEALCGGEQNFEAGNGDLYA